MLAINPAVGRDAIIRAAFHDVGEIWSGDAPYPVKADHPVLKAEMDMIERAGHLSMVIPWGLPPPRQASMIEEWCLKLAEMIETWEFALQEMMMGNLLARLIYDRNTQWLDRVLAQASADPHLEIATRASDYMMRRRSTWSMTL